MKRHPQFAYEMLQPIAYLRDALNIPYCHHEKWDGTGYPCGLSGTQIPLEARLFAIVDVWDAITSDRPYRKKWTKRKALKWFFGNSRERYPDFGVQGAYARLHPKIWSPVTAEPGEPLKYISEQNGKQFDPQVVEVFLREIVGQ